VVVAFYLLSFVDRANTGNAQIATFQRNIGITNDQYSIALTVT